MLKNVVTLNKYGIYKIERVYFVYYISIFSRNILKQKLIPLFKCRKKEVFIHFFFGKNFLKLIKLMSSSSNQFLQKIPILFFPPI